MKRLVLFLSVLALAFFTTQCKKQIKENDLSSEDVQLITKTDLITEDLVFSIESMFEQSANRSSSNNTSNHHPSCVSITRTLSGDTLHVTLSFDPAGCQMPNGHTYTGTVDILSFNNHSTHQATLEVTLSDDFSVDGIDIDGYFTRTHVWINAAGHPESTVEFDLQVTWPNGDTATRTGTRTREWIEGYNTPGYHADDVWLITGNWHIVQRNGDTYDITVTTPLRREFTCAYFVSGEMEIIFNGETYLLDFGNGTCDNEATLTLPNGNTVTITL